MGLYDEIVCEAPLPWPEFFTENKVRVFQTKDLDCYLANFKISADGRLYKVENTYEEIPINEEVKEKRKGTKSEWLNSFPEQKIVKTTLIPMSFTGSITFYDYVHGQENDFWIEFVGLFSNGYLVKTIEQQNCTCTSNKERLEREEQYKIQYKERIAYLNTWRGKLHSFVSRLVFKFLNKVYFRVLNKLMSFGYFIQKHIK